jgi:hypothetical protein
MSTEHDTFLCAQVAFNFTQPELEALGSCLLSGGYFGLIPGFLYDALRHRHKLGPRCSNTLPLPSSKALLYIHQPPRVHAFWKGADVRGATAAG